MSRKCIVTKKKTSTGKSYSKRGIAKKKKGIGLNITGCVKRRFLPNIFKKRFWYSEENRFITLKLSMHGLRILDKVGINKTVAKLRAEGEKV
ncbi:50S ribosomal protein L28 [Candidatus Aerophobetes bacterium]|uniref:Large ribosomal subunit protein bL28 n=1 Tax=Aerophobetes bacterium TaxID=2030807 RepID=A0A2A4X5V6_UNCAE|nr:MAG: 50S ribosomal protein L28 [Candidatus Aerophobetes bacterium]